MSQMAPTSAQVLIRDDDILPPLLDTSLGFLTALAGPMIFLSIIWSIYSMGDMNTFSSYGKKLTGKFCRKDKKKQGIYPLRGRDF